MKRFKRLKNAPIIEALIDIQVQLDPELTVEKLKELIPASISSAFPQYDERKVIEAEFSQSAKGKLHQNLTDHGTVGYLLRDKDNKKVVQIRLNGFGFSHLQQYSDFESFQNEAMNLWREYKKFAMPNAISRVALLYVNILDLGKKVNSLEDFAKVLTTVPRQPVETEAEAINFFSQFQLSRSSENLTAVITQQAVHNLQTGSSGIKFQIDASRVFSQSPEEDDLWQTVAKLRDFKNEIFFGSLSTKQIEKYEAIIEQ